MSLTAPLPFIDLKAQRRRLGPQIEQALVRVLEHGAFILGPEVRDLEAQLAAYAGVKHCISCASGTDALMMVLMAKGIGPGDAIFCPSFTFAATAEVVALLGASPIFVDVCADDFNIDPESLKAALPVAEAAGLTPRGIIAVDLFGQPADYRALQPLADANGLWILADAAQSFGASHHNRRVGALGDFATTSFFPAKPLGCYGDGGAIFTNDDDFRDVLHSIRVHGQGRDKYENVRLGITGRLDTMQAAVLLQKMTIFDDEIAARNAVAERYAAGLPKEMIVPTLLSGRSSVWAQYTVLLENRDAVQQRLQADGIPTMVYYMRPLHTQPPYQKYPQAPGGLAVTGSLSQKVLSLPMHPYLDAPTQERILSAAHRAVAA
jgi:dTDP-4-amino-4,6-dideoxygalactose transaminase